MKSRLLYSSKIPIFYISIGDLINRKIIVDYFPQEKDQKDLYQETFLKIIDKLILIQSPPNDRYKQLFDEDKIFHCITDNKAHFCFSLLIYENYPERYCYKLLTDLENKSISTLNKHYFYKINNENYLEYKFVKEIQLYMVELERYYRDIVGKDKIRLIQNDVNDMKIVIKDKMNIMVNNIELLSDLKDKALDLKNEAREFKNNGKKIKKITIWQKRKNIIIVGSFISVLIYIGFIFLK